MRSILMGSVLVAVATPAAADMVVTFEDYPEFDHVVMRYQGNLQTSGPWVVVDPPFGGEGGAQDPPDDFIFQSNAFVDPNDGRVSISMDIDYQFYWGFATEEKPDRIEVISWPTFGDGRPYGDPANPATFVTFASSGDNFGFGFRDGSCRLGCRVEGDPYLKLPKDFTSGDSLAGAAIFEGESLSSMGILPGPHVFAWETPRGIETITVNTVRAVPEPSQWAMVLVAAVISGVAYTRSKAPASASDPRV